HRDGTLLFHLEFIYTYNDLFSRLDLSLVFIGAPGNLFLDKTLFDGADAAAQGIYLSHQFPGFLFHRMCEGLYKIAARQRIGRVGCAGFISYYLLRAERDPGRLFRRKAERLVISVGMK